MKQTYFARGNPEEVHIGKQKRKSLYSVVHRRVSEPVIGIDDSALKVSTTRKESDAWLSKLTSIAW
jgi:hypothetical protein